ncbi:MAG: leucine-rich repeat domain-containing protein, partial [Ureaplasma sp.]|nr:leucine-rich repeat domain-containing protein [Ureaplasma sp.]
EKSSKIEIDVDALKTLTNDYCFNGIGATTVNLPKNLTIINEGLFSNCRNLESVVIPNKVTTINNYLVFSNQNLKTITLPDSVTSVKVNSFSASSNVVIKVPSQRLKNLILQTTLFRGTVELI